jgi:hypothetical protein
MKPETESGARVRSKVSKRVGTVNVVGNKLAWVAFDGDDGTETPVLWTNLEPERRQA